MIPSLSSQQANAPKCPTLEMHSEASESGGDVNPGQFNNMREVEETAACLTSSNVGHSPPLVAQERKPALTERHLQAIDLMLRGACDTDIAEEIGVDRKTVYRWRRTPAFARELELRRTAFQSFALDRLHALVPDALEVIGRHMDDATTQRAFRAAALVLKTAVAVVTRTRSNRGSDHPHAADAEQESV